MYQDSPLTMSHGVLLFQSMNRLQDGFRAPRRCFNQWLVMLAGLLGLIFVSTSTAAAVEYVHNGQFTAWDGDTVSGWQLASSGRASIRLDPAEAPRGLSSSLRIDIAGAGAGLGQVVSSKAAVEPGSILYLKGWMKSDNAAGGMIQVKLYQGRKEIKRINISERSGHWLELDREFEVGEADSFQVLLRYKQSESSVGRSLWFADLSVIPASERVRTAPSIANLAAVSTFSSIGLYADISGDMSQFTRGHSAYRKKGESVWRPSLPMQWQAKTKQLRSSLLNLEADTEYQIKTWLEDPSLKEAIAPAYTKVRTWTDELPIAKTIYLPAGESTEPLVITESGSADGWIRYTSDPTHLSTLNVDKRATHAVVLKGVHHVILDNLTIVGGIKDSVLIEDSTDIRILRCDISSWGQVGTFTEMENKRWGRGPFFVDEAGKPVNLQGGVRVSVGAERVVIADNYIHNPRGHATSWQYGHPHGPTSIILFNSEGNHVIRNNSLIGSESHRFNDTIEGAYNDKPKGGPYRDTDFEGNIMFFSNDDGVELDGGQMNIRFFNNWIQSSYCGVSTAPTIFGPSYIFNNLIVLEGDERGMTNFALKVGGDKVQNPGINYFFHNTIYSHGRGLRGSNWGSGPTPIFTRNNLFAAGDLMWPQKSKGDFDYDMLRPNSMDPPLPQWQQNGVVGVESFKNRAAGDYRLSKNSLAIDRGLKLLTVNEDFSGEAPDIGAFPVGAGPEFPVRAEGVSLLPLQAQLELTLNEGAVQTDTLYVRAPVATGKRWRVMSDDAWLQYEPSTGPCDGELHAVTLSIHPDVKRDGYYQGAVTVRTDAGYNRTSFVKAKVRLAAPDYQYFNAVDMEQVGMTVVAADAQAPQLPYLQAPDTRDAASEAWMRIDFEVPESGTYYLHGLIAVLGPNAPAHDSCYVQVNDGEPKYWDLAVSAPGLWTWQTASIMNEAYPREIELAAGKHTIYIRGRENFTKFARFAISRTRLLPE